MRWAVRVDGSEGASVRRIGSSLIVVGLLAVLVPLSGVGAQGDVVPPELRALYDPGVVRGFGLEMKPKAGFELPEDWTPAEGWPEGWDDLSDAERDAALEEYRVAEAIAAAWDIVRFDTTNSIELPAVFTDGVGPPRDVLVRRKSSRPLPSEDDPQKVGLKVRFQGGDWNGVTRLSLENAGDLSVVAEGLAWNFHQMAVGDGLYGDGHDPALAAWTTLTMNGRSLGVYTSVEQRNKAFLRNRGFWPRSGAWSSTWLYKGDDLSVPVLEDGPNDGSDSPVHTQLCFKPFRPSATCPTPTDAELATLLPAVIDIDAMLTQMAVDALAGNGDALAKGKNFHFVDRVVPGSDPAEVVPRLYYPWDLDAVFGGSGLSSNIYSTGTSTVRKKTTYTQSEYQKVLLNHPDFRVRYNAIMLRLIDGPLSVDAVAAHLERVKPALAPALSSDEFVQAELRERPEAHIDSFLNWYTTRVANVREQVANNLPAPRAPYPGGPDLTAPSVGAVTLSPSTAVVGAAVSVSATATDNVGVMSADVRVGEFPWEPLAATDGTFGGTTEQVTGSVSAPLTVGTHQICVRALDAAGLMSQSCATLTTEASREVTAFSAIGPSSVRANATYTLTATLTAGDTPVSGRTVTFTVNKATFTGTTSAQGVVTVVAKAPAKTGNYLVDVRFAGDAAYRPASSSATLTVTK
jgi:hypothetical protein